MQATLSLTISRANLLTANQRLHHHAKAKLVKGLRRTGHTNAAAQALPTFQRAHVLVTIEWPDRRRRDAHNIMPTLKALLDGFTDYGLWPDDNDNHLVGPDLRKSPNLSGIKGVTRLIFTITETTE